VTADPFALFDGAYVLGALSDEDRRAFEAHLVECDECSASVRELSDLPGMLATVPESALTDEAPPLSLLPALQRRARRDIHRRRWIMSSVGAAAAACLIAVAVIVSRPSHTPAPVGHPVAMRPVTSAPIVATADVRSVGWGTKIDVVCRYLESDEATRPYALFVVAKSGERHQLGSWNLAPGKATKYEAGTSLDRSQIREIDVTTATGMPLLTLPL
jgi:hypothetical protein